MAQKVIIPRMGQTMTEGTVARFLVKDGDRVEATTDIYELEYDKSTANIPAKKAGIVRLLVAEGAVVPLGQPVAVILEDGETLESVNLQGNKVAIAPKEKSAPVEAPAAPAAPAPAPAAAPKAAGNYGATPRIKALAREMGIDLAEVVPADGKRYTKEDLEAYAKAKTEAAAAPAPVAEAPAAEYRVSPLARKVAAELGVDVSKVVPADGKRVTRDDVTAYAEAAKGNAADFHGGPECGTTCRRCSFDMPAAPAADRREPLRGMRKVIADRMKQSADLYPSATLTTKIDMTELVKMRQQLNGELSKKGIKLSMTDLLVKAVAKALRENEIINTSLIDNEIIYHADINIGIAVALPNGLVVPVVRNADKLSLEQINAESKRLVGLAKGGGLGGDDMRGGTFSITNLGMVGIDAFTPIINMPESAILGIGRTVEEPSVVDGQICIRSKAIFSITHDHRVIDGYPAALFLQSLTRFIENPFLLMLD